MATQGMTRETKSGPVPEKDVRAEPASRRGPLALLSRIPGRGRDSKLANFLGAFSVGLGLTEILAPRALAGLIGVRPRPLLFRLLGLREIASGIGIFAQRKPAGALWSRVAGDVMDLSLLATALTSHDTRKGRCIFAATQVLGVTALDAFAAQRHGRTRRRVVKTIAVNRTPGECYAYWRQLENLPRFLRQLESVEVLDEVRSRWVAKGPGGRTVEWEAEIVRDEPGALISWQSVEGSAVKTRGVVQFNPRPGGRGTLVHVALTYDPPGGSLGALVAKLTVTSPEQQVKDNLRNFKQMIETGEVPTTEGQPSGRREPLHRSLAKLFTGGVS